MSRCAFYIRQAMRAVDEAAVHAEGRVAREVKIPRSSWLLVFIREGVEEVLGPNRPREARELVADLQIRQPFRRTPDRPPVDESSTRRSGSRATS